MTKHKSRSAWVGEVPDPAVSLTDKDKGYPTVSVSGMRESASIGLGLYEESERDGGTRGVALAIWEEVGARDAGVQPDAFHVLRSVQDLRDLAMFFMEAAEWVSGEKEKKS